jgi:hypothetical protein
VITIISPAKSMDFTPISLNVGASFVKVSKNMEVVLKKLKSLSVMQIAKLMKVSEKIAKLNHQRFQDFEKSSEKQAIFAYTGDVYKNIDVENFSNSQLDFAQEHLRIISALYGVVLPLDKIKAYRLEMSCKLPGVGTGPVSEFWKNYVTSELNAALLNHKNKYLINLASNEYSAALLLKELDAKVINIHFRENRKGVLKNIALNSKRARGMMSDYIVRNEIDAPEGLKFFDVSGYKFDSSLSDRENFFFIK